MIETIIPMFKQVHAAASGILMIRKNTSLNILRTIVERDIIIDVRTTTTILKKEGDPAMKGSTEVKKLNPNKKVYKDKILGDSFISVIASLSEVGS
jgi:hypothetical protein